MPDRKVYHTTYNRNRERWENTLEGAARPSSTHKTKTEAIQRVRELAKKATLGQAKIHKKDGRFQTEWTYGKDPRRTKG